MNTLDSMIDEFFSKLGPTEYQKKETHQYTMTLPSSIMDGSHKWTCVGWALANTDHRLFTWLKFSSQDICRDTLKGPDGKFDWNHVPELYEQWKSFDTNNPDSLSHRSIMYWSKIDAYDKCCKEVRNETIDYYIDITIDKITEWDLANVLFNIFKDQFACVSIKIIDGMSLEITDGLKLIQEIHFAIRFLAICIQNMCNVFSVIRFKCNQWIKLMRVIRNYSKTYV